MKEKSLQALLEGFFVCVGLIFRIWLAKRTKIGTLWFIPIDAGSFKTLLPMTPPLIETKLNAVFYQTETGNEPVREWLKSLPAHERKAIGIDICTVQIGYPIGMPLVRKMKGKYKICEVRTDLINRIARVFFIVDGDSMVLLHGFIKKSQATPVAKVKKDEGQADLPPTDVSRAA